MIETQYGNTENRVNRRLIRKLQTTGVTEDTRRTGNLVIEEQ